MSELKPICKEAIPRALARAERYRLLSEPHEAESICRDVLRADPDNQDALVMLLLALTDQFGGRADISLNDTRELLERIRGEYQRAYYGGVVYERWGKALLRTEGLGHAAHEWIREAMRLYEAAEPLRPKANDEAILRWNACLRLIQRDPRLAPRTDEPMTDVGAGDDPPVPVRYR